MTTTGYNSIDLRTREDRDRRLRFARVLGVELMLSGAHYCKPGTLAHEQALDRAWRAAKAWMVE